MLHQETSKINWLRILQGWTMLWVVIGHSSSQIPHSEMSNWYSDLLTDIAYSFHMPMFIFISGYLFYLTRIQNNTPYLWMIKDKVIRLGIPYVFFSVFAMVLKSCFGSEMQRPSEISFREFGHAFLYPDDGPVSGFWFIAVISWCFLLYPLWKFLLRNSMTVLFGLLCTLALSVWMPCFADNLLCIPKFLAHSFYFLLGIVVCRYGICDMMQPRALFFGIVSLLSFIFLFVWQIDGLHVLTAMMGMLFSICLAQVLNRINPEAFSSFRNYTYQIYLMAIFFQISCKILFNLLSFDNFCAFSICVLVGLYFPVLISKLIQTINFAPLCMVVGMKYKSDK